MRRPASSCPAVLTEDRRVACEWPALGQIELPNLVRPALCEFSEYGGVHAVDGHLTGVLPARIPTFGVGIHGRKEEIVYPDDLFFVSC